MASRPISAAAPKSFPLILQPSVQPQAVRDNEEAKLNTRLEAWGKAQAWRELASSEIVELPPEERSRRQKIHQKVASVRTGVAVAGAAAGTLAASSAATLGSAVALAGVGMDGAALAAGVLGILGGSVGAVGATEQVYLRARFPRLSAAIERRFGDFKPPTRGESGEKIVQDMSREFKAASGAHRAALKVVANGWLVQGVGLANSKQRKALDKMASDRKVTEEDFVAAGALDDFMIGRNALLTRAFTTETEASVVERHVGQFAAFPEAERAVLRPALFDDVFGMNGCANQLGDKSKLRLRISFAERPRTADQAFDLFVTRLQWMKSDDWTRMRLDQLAKLLASLPPERAQNLRELVSARIGMGDEYRIPDTMRPWVDRLLCNASDSGTDYFW